MIRYFEITPEPPFVHYINTFQTPDPQRGIGMISKRGCDVSTCEITRFYRINNNGFCQVIPFVVPRKSELFQEDLYPDTLADVPALTADDWWSGTNADPILVPMSEQGVEVKKVNSKLSLNETERRPTTTTHFPFSPFMHLTMHNESYRVSPLSFTQLFRVLEKQEKTPCSVVREND